MPYDNEPASAGKKVAPKKVATPESDDAEGEESGENSDEENGEDNESEEEEEEEEGDQEEDEEEDEDEKPREEKERKGATVKSKVLKMFARKNQAALSEHYAKLRANEDESGAEDADDFMKIKRKDHEIDDSKEGPLPLSRRDILKSKKRHRLKILGNNSKVHFDDDGNETKFWQLETEQEFASKVDPTVERQKYVATSSTLLTEADVEDKQTQKARLKALKLKKKMARKGEEHEVCHLFLFFPFSVAVWLTTLCCCSQWLLSSPLEVMTREMMALMATRMTTEMTSTMPVNTTMWRMTRHLPGLLCVFLLANCAVPLTLPSFLCNTAASPKRSPSGNRTMMTAFPRSRHQARSPRGS